LIIIDDITIEETKDAFNSLLSFVLWAQILCGLACFNSICACCLCSINKAKVAQENCEEIVHQQEIQQAAMNSIAHN